MSCNWCFYTNLANGLHVRSALRRRWGSLSLVLVAVALGLALLPGCGPKTVEKAEAAPPPPLYTGPAFLRGTVGSLTRLRGYEPLPVSGWGVVVGLDGTGSTNAPAFLRQWLINEMRKMGVGSARLATTGTPLAGVSPDVIIADPNNAIVEIIGQIPPGATRGSRFDIIVQAVEGTQTTSLENGLLFTADLGLFGAHRRMQFARKQAEAYGSVYVDPFEEWADERTKLEVRRRAVILSGGVVEQDRRIELVLNQPSFQRSRDIAGRINERFPASPSDRRPTAVPRSDLLIDINVPRRFRSDPDKFLALVSHLYLQRREGFEPAQAQVLADVLESNPEYANEVMLSWMALGRTIYPVLRHYYEHDDVRIRMAALEAGAYLGDERSSESLLDLTNHPQSSIRQRIAEALVHLPQSLRGARALRQLLDDEDEDVRVRAYESLVNVNDPIVQRVPILDEQDRLKFFLDLVPAERPLVYVSQAGMPVMVIFNPELEFETPLLARVWQNRLIIRAEDPGSPATVYYQAPRQAEFQEFTIAPTLANLVFLLAHRPTVENPTHGLDMTYSQVANAVYNLCLKEDAPYPIRVQESALAREVERIADELPGMPRPETGQATEGGPPTDPSETFEPATGNFIDMPVPGGLEAVEDAATPRPDTQAPEPPQTQR